MTTKCYSCKGNKQLLSLGNLMKPCSTCNGVGYLAETEKLIMGNTNSAVNSIPVVATINQVNGIDTDYQTMVKKKPGRKPKTSLEIPLNC